MSKDKEFNIKINGLKEGIKDVKDLKGSLDNSKKSMEDQNKTVGDYSKAIREASKEIKAIQGEMLGLEKGSKAWTELAKKAGDYKDRIDDIREATKRWASDTKQLDDIINLAQSATAAFTLYKGAMSAFGMETEKAEEAIQKLAGAMSIIQSLQALQNTLKGSSATAALLNGAMKALTFGIEGTTVATKALRIALMSIGIGIIIALVSELVIHWEDLCDWFNKTFPIVNKVGGVFNGLKAIIMGLGKAIVNWCVNPLKTFADVVKKLMAGDFAGAIKAATDGIKNQFIGTAEAFKKGFQEQVERGLEEMSLKTLEETNKQTQYELNMLKARLGNEAKYSKAGIALQKKDFAERRKLAKGNKDELNKINLEEATFFRECQEHKAAAAKKSADERKKAEKAAADEAKKLAAEAEKKRKEEEKAAEEARKAELERIKELNNARRDGANYEIEYQKAVLDERKRVVNESLSGEEKVIKKLEGEINALEKIANNDKLSKKTRMQATVQLESAMAKLMKAEENRKNLLDKEAELEREILRLNKEKAENAVYEELRNNLQMFSASKEELTALIDGTSDKLGDLSETQQQYVENTKKQLMTIARTFLTAMAMVNSSTKKKKEEGDSASSGGTSDDDDNDKKPKKLSPSDKEDFYLAFGQEVANTIVDSMDTISMFMDFAIEETQRALEEIQELHDKALDRVNESADKIKELNAKLKDSADTNKAAVQEQLADEQLLYAKRLAEEKKLQEEEKKLKNKAAQQEAKARKVELATQMVMGIANTAQGITKALATFAPPYSIILAAAVGALGAIQTAMIAAQIAKVKPVKYAEGGILSGPSHSEGGIPVGRTNIEVEGGEMVVSKRNTERYRDVLYKINRNDPSVRYLQGSRGTYVDTKIRKYADGGELNFEAADASLRANNSTDRLMSAIGGIDMHPVVSVVDIATVQDRLVRVRGLAGR